MDGSPQTEPASAMPNPPCIPALPLGDTGEHRRHYHVQSSGQQVEPLPMDKETAFNWYSTPRIHSHLGILDSLFLQTGALWLIT